MTSSVLKMMIVSIIMCPVQALCGFCGYCSSGRLAREAMTDCPVAKLRRRVLFLCGRESSYTGGKGMGFLEVDRKTMVICGKRNNYVALLLGNVVAFNLELDQRILYDLL